MKFNPESLRMLIIRNQFTQREVAEKIGMDPSSFNNMLRNGSTSPLTIQKLTEVLKCTQEDIIMKYDISNIEEPMVKDPSNQYLKSNTDIPIIMKNFEKCLELTTQTIKDYTSQQNKAWEVVDRAMAIIERNMDSDSPGRQKERNTG